MAVIECAHEIPCNPCESSCKFGAIEVGSPITNLPKIVEEKCIACGQCVISCPGLAIFIVDKTYSDTEGIVSFPYEYYPLPEEGSTVKAVTRSGHPICDGRVLKVRLTKQADRTPIVTVAVPIEHVDMVRSIKRLGSEISEEEALTKKLENELTLTDDVVVCRCEEVTLGEIRQAIREGARDVNGVKRRTRAGMGLCQGRSCEKMVQQILKQELGEAPEEILYSTARPPVKPISFSALARGVIDEEL